MRIAYVCTDPGVPVFGRKGASVHVQEVVRAMLRRGAQVELFANRSGGDAPSGLAAVPVHALPRVAKGERSIRERSALAANEGLRATLEREGPFAFVYERYALWSFAGMEYARAIGVPGLLEVNAPLIEEQARHRGLENRPAAERVAERAFGAATALLAVSAEVAAYLEGEPAARGRVHIVANGVDPSRFSQELAPARSSADAFTIGFVGTLRPWHGLETLVEAFAALRGHCPRARLLIVGDGPGRADLAADLAARGLAGYARLTGAVEPDEIPSLIASMDVAVAPYPDLDRFYFSPLKVYEYLAGSIPVVASRIGQLAEIIEDGVSGLLCPPGDAAALAAALARLEAEPGLRERLGRAGRANVVLDHTWDAVAERIFDLSRVEASRPAVAGRAG